MKKNYSYFKKHDFIILDFDKLNFEEQLSYIFNSEILVSVHGAALTHMLWMKENSKIFEIRTKDNCHDNCYYSLASDLGHDYFYSQAYKTNSEESNHTSNLQLDKKNFLSELYRMLSIQ